jgi:hypothetical protein
MPMACQISISKNDRHLFSTEIISFRHIQHFQTVFGILNVKFPENKGFNLQIHRFPRHMPAISREDFRKACLPNSWRAALDCFILDEELDAFRATREPLDLDDADQVPESTSEADTLKAIFRYQNEIVILQYGDHPPRYFVPGDTLFESDDLATAEKECYRVFLRINDNVPFEEQ